MKYLALALIAIFIFSFDISIAFAGGFLLSNDFRKNRNGKKRRIFRNQFQRWRQLSRPNGKYRKHRSNSWTIP